MSRALHIDPSDAAPIWRQIEEGLRRLVASGALVPGEAVPSVRDLAKELRVNPATVAKAYQRLVDAGVLMVKRGEGTFVAESRPVMGIVERKQLLREGAIRYATTAITIGASSEEAILELKEAIEQISSSELETEF
ncbi:MAG: GntR family transcriptional regulator [Blastocatellia bacterium]|nr:GntR family transcriptional regulator [Blastocatellia bacterium]MBL8195116.1 GntR family transcriptional regulator [Blastocatellia bacterium]MBN8722078.1 GntR family transcriptional regulator [Acidobacteriota bacterium]